MTRRDSDPSLDTEHDKLARALLAVFSVARDQSPLIICHAQATALLEQGWRWHRP